MPAKSEDQRKFMSAVLSYKEGKMPDASNQVKRAAEGMDKKQILDFVKKEGFLAGESDKNMLALEQLYCNESDVMDEDDSKKYGRGKLFNIPAMMEIINKSNFLKNQYDKMKESGKEIFGYHYNEIILSFIFIKYVKSDEALYKKYLELRDMKIKDKEIEDTKKDSQDKIDKEREFNAKVSDADNSEEEKLKPSKLAIGRKEELKETDSSSSGQYSSPVAFAKDEKNWKFGKKPAMAGGTIIKPNLNTHVQGLNSFKMIAEEKTRKYHKSLKKDYNRDLKQLIDPEFLLESINNVGNDITPLNIVVKSVNGTRLSDAIKSNPKKMNVIFIVDKDDSQEEYNISLTLDEYLKYVLDNYTEYKDNNNTLLQDGLKNAIRQVLTDTMSNTIDKPLENYIITNFEKANPMEVVAMNDVNENQMVKTRPEITSIILGKTNGQYTADQLGELSEDDLYKLYIDVESGLEDQKQKPEVLEKAPINEKIMTRDDLTRITDKIKDTNKIKNMEDNKKESLNEEAKPAALTLLDRIKKDNEANEKTYFEDLNKGIQDQIKNPGEGGQFEYDYDKDPKGVDEKEHLKNQKYINSDVVNQHIADNRGRQLYDIDFDVQPNDAWLKNFKETIGEDMYKAFLRKIEQRQLEKKNMRDVEIDDHKNADKRINLTPDLTPDKMIKEQDDSKSTGYYLDSYNQKKFVTIKLNEAKECDEVPAGYKEIIFEGLGNAYSSVIENGKLKSLLKESEEKIGFNKYFYNFVDNSVIKVSESINEETAKLKDIKLIAENYKKQFDTFAKYEGSYKSKSHLKKK